jgi:uncharacterized membrane protein YhdT
MVIFASFILVELYLTVWPVASSYIPQSVSDIVKSKVLFRLLCFSPPIIFVLASFIIIFTNRIAGPLYRLEKTFDRLLQGEDVDILHLREKDELKPLISKINKIILHIKDLKRQKNNPSSG